MKKKKLQLGHTIDIVNHPRNHTVGGTKVKVVKSSTSTVRIKGYIKQ